MLQPSVRKQHNSGYKHKANVRSYYQQFEEQQTQSLIDQRIKEHLGQAAAFQQVSGAYNHLMGQRPNLPPVLPPPRFPFPGGQPLMPGFRPLMPRPLPIPGAPGECFPICTVCNLHNCHCLLLTHFVVCVFCILDVVHFTLSK
ncbi:hypothetical protein KIW84_064571 [Lathyrus oleraceus]|uniref:U1-C C2H2-type zinc finger domain-containing protein n=1 Tax=Pisum sativum TaxID=3888 RepID=A0A9D5A6C0_PEA|nr:hypothetical protein KIW84_064571 [Pisum sativum]